MGSWATQASTFIKQEIHEFVVYFWTESKRGVLDHCQFGIRNKDEKRKEKNWKICLEFSEDRNAFVAVSLFCFTTNFPKESTNHRNFFLFWRGHVWSIVRRYSAKNAGEPSKGEGNCRDFSSQFKGTIGQAEGKAKKGSRFTGTTPSRMYRGRNFGMFLKHLSGILATLPGSQMSNFLSLLISL